MVQWSMDGNGVTVYPLHHHHHYDHHQSPSFIRSSSRQGRHYVAARRHHYRSSPVVMSPWVHESCRRRRYHCSWVGAGMSAFGHARSA